MTEPIVMDTYPTTLNHRANLCEVNTLFRQVGITLINARYKRHVQQMESRRSVEVVPDHRATHVD